MKTEVLEKAGKKVPLLGNEAIARGALEAGVGVVAAYPGTPSSEVPMTFSAIAKKAGIYFEYSSNEKVAFETAAGAAWSGVKALTAMKHFGLNVASDSVSPVAYAGVREGLVIMVADDPNGWSSAQSEQDTRYFARMARIPMLDPANPQECLDYTKLAFQISKEFEVPIFLRTTTKVSHSIGTVKLGPLKRPNKKGKFKKSLDLYYNIRPELQKLHERLDKKLEGVEKKYANKLNKVIPGKGKIGIITSGVSAEYAHEASHILGIKAPVAKIGLTHPLSKDFIAKFIKGKSAVLVLEELEPIIENLVAAVAKDVNPKLTIYGKNLLLRSGEYNLENVIPVLQKIFKTKSKLEFKKHAKKVESALKGLPPRKPTLCQGCPHRSTFYAVKQVFGNKTLYPGDIGCYVMGIFEPFEMQDFAISMGASLGLAHGISRVSNQDIVPFIGDSTFFHASMPAIANFKHNDERCPLVVILDNDITAMTGHQPHPGSGFTGMGEKVEPIDIANVVQALGSKVAIANSFSQKQLIRALTKLKKVKGPRALISRGECRLLTKRKLRKKGLNFLIYEIDTKKCVKCGICTDKFSCPAIEKVRVKGRIKYYKINPDTCWGCSVCMQVCPYNAIKLSRKEVKK